MSTSSTDKRVDPLIDAYRQASELEAQSAGVRPRAALRAAVLAHARVVAQSAATAAPTLVVSEAVRAAPAANDSKPVWRMVAGVMLGLAGMWVYQLTRSGSTDEANVAVLTAPQSAKSAATEPVPATGTTGAPVAPVTVDVAPTAAPATAKSATPLEPAQRETSVAIATLPKPASSAVTVSPVATARGIPARDRASGTSNSAEVNGPRDGIADAARSDMSVALARVDAPAKRAERAAPVAAQTAAAGAPLDRATAAPATTSAIPEVATSEPFVETAVASAEMRKTMRPGAAARAPAPAATAPAIATAPPTAFPATTSGAMAAAAPPPAAPAMSPQSAAVGGSATPLQGIASTPDAAMFSAIRIGDVNALRAALARGANVNARDETGRSALQIARDRSDLTMLKALESAGAK